MKRRIVVSAVALASMVFGASQAAAIPFTSYTVTCKDIAVVYPFTQPDLSGTPLIASNMNVHCNTEGRHNIKWRISMRLDRKVGTEYKTVSTQIFTGRGLDMATRITAPCVRTTNARQAKSYRAYGFVKLRFEEAGVERRWLINTGVTTKFVRLNCRT